MLISVGALTSCQKSSLAQSKGETSAMINEKSLEEEDFENGESLKKYSRPKIVHLPAKR